MAKIVGIDLGTTNSLATVEQMNGEFDVDAVLDGSWYEEDEDGREIESSFREWDKEKDQGDGHDK